MNYATLVQLVAPVFQRDPNNRLRVTNNALDRLYELSTQLNDEDPLLNYISQLHTQLRHRLVDTVNWLSHPFLMDEQDIEGYSFLPEPGVEYVDELDLPSEIAETLIANSP